MKQKIYLILAGLFLLSHQLKAQSPNALNYQGVARNAGGNTIPNQRISLRFTILQGTPTGTSVYQETWTDTTNEFGLFTVAIGNGLQAGSNTFKSINWSKGPYYLEVEMDPQGGASYLNMGTNQLLSVPYALYAANAGSGGTAYTAGSGISITDSVISADTAAAVWNANKLQGDSVSNTPPTTGQVLQWNGTAWAPATTQGIAVNIISSDYTATGSDYFIEGNCNGSSITVTLPDATTLQGKVYYIAANNITGTNTLTITTTGAQVIGNYGTSILLSNNFEQEYIVSDGSNWFILSGSHL